MPRVTVEMLEGRTIEQKRALIKEICEATCEIFNIPPTHSMVRFDEIRFEDFGISGELRCDVSLREGHPVYGNILEPRLTVLLSVGRTMDQKRAFVKRVSEKTAEILNVPLKSVVVFMLEMKLDEFAMGGVFYIDGSLPDIRKKDFENK
jgi:4-oxalocrotonate tautomerase